MLARTGTLRPAGGDDDLMRWFLCSVFRWKKLNVVPWKSRARKSRARKLKSCQKIHVMPECWSRAGVTADLDAPRIWTPPQSKFVSGYGSHPQKLDVNKLLHSNYWNCHNKSLLRLMRINIDTKHHNNSGNYCVQPQNNSVWFSKIITLNSFWTRTKKLLLLQVVRKAYDK